MGFTDRKPWTITEKDVTTKWGLSGDHRLHCYLCGKIAEVGDTFRWLYMNGASPSPGNVMCCAGCDHVGIEDEIRAALVAWKKDFPGCNYEIRPAMKLAQLEAELSEARRDGERLDEAERLKLDIRANAMTGKWEVVTSDPHPAHRRYYQKKTLRAAIDAARGGAGMRDPRTDPRPGDVVVKGQRQRTVAARRGSDIDYIEGKTNGFRNCWITTWCEWCRKAEVLHVANES